MIGGGTVGSGVFHALQLNGGLMASRIGVKLGLTKVAVKAVDEPRPYPIPAGLMTTDWQSVVRDPQIHVVVELVGGTNRPNDDPEALKLGKPVITANKALLSAHGRRAVRRRRAARHESLLRSQRLRRHSHHQSVARRVRWEPITQLYGIVNGTCNYILTRMKLEGAEFADGAERRPSAGLCRSGAFAGRRWQDAQHKIGILASLAHGFWVNPKHIHVEGIRHITRADIQFAGQLGYTIKLLGIIKDLAGGGSTEVDRKGMKKGKANAAKPRASRSRSTPR